MGLAVGMVQGEELALNSSSELSRRTLAIIYFVFV